MSVSFLARDWIRLPSRIALLLGFGALSAAGARASAPEIDFGTTAVPVPQQSGKGFGELLVWVDSGRIYLSQSGRPAQQLPLGDTAEARHLRQLLEREGATPASPRVVPDRMILVGGGGSGIGWVPADRSQGAALPTAPADPNVGRAAPGGPATGFAPPRSGTPGMSVPYENRRLPGNANTPHRRENG